VSQATGGAGADTLSYFENLTGSQYDDLLTGDDLSNTLSGGSGDDLITGLKGKDRFFGEGDIDKLLARDGKRDAKINCGPGANGQEKARIDRGKDPAPKSC
jgi:Ca2+-binding RTX toxin-like protein